METIDRQKSEVALKTAHELQVAFGEIFKELVPRGFGEMILYGDEEDVRFDKNTAYQNVGF